ncbi:hypothetical protein RKD18_007569 [Streptomyces phaeoluteigriseus]
MPPLLAQPPGAAPLTHERSRNARLTVACCVQGGTRPGVFPAVGHGCRLVADPGARPRRPETEHIERPNGLDYTKPLTCDSITP